MADRMVLFGGTFDPVHNGHLIVARAIAGQLGLQRVTLMPTARPPHKPAASASGEDRLKMLHLAIAGEELFEVCDLELNRPGPSYTLQTVREIRRQHGRDLAVELIIGADMLQELPRWHQVSELLDSVSFIIVSRPGVDQQMDHILAEIGQELGQDCAQRLSSSIVTAPLIDISSTDIRRRVRAGLSIEDLAPEPVVAYICEKGLYKI